MPAWLGRWLRSPGCRAYAVLLARVLRARGHEASVRLGAGRDGAHAWVECSGRAYDLAHPEGADAPGFEARFGPVTTFAGNEEEAPG